MKKKIFFSLLVILLAAIAVIVAINLIDESLNPDAFTLADLPPLNFEASNGYYIVCGLMEPEDVDFQSEAFIKPIREYYGSSFREMLYNDDFKLPYYMKAWSHYARSVRQIDFPASFQINLIGHLTPQWELVEKVEQELKLPLKRWRKLLACEVVQDFTLPYNAAQVPHVSPVLNLARIYTYLALKKAVAGNWKEGAADLLGQVELGKKLNTHGRSNVSSMFGCIVNEISLRGLISMLNHPECPETVVKQILDGLPPIKYEEYGNHYAFIGYCINDLNNVDLIKKFETGLLGKLFFQLNTTKNYYHELYSKCIAYDRQDPYLWKRDPKVELREFVKSKITGLLWRLKNSMGKMSFAMTSVSDSPFLRSNRLRARYMMTRILAELRLKYTEGRDVQDVLDELDTYKTMDPCSGKPFVLNKKSWVLYSIGVDRKDGGGIERNTTDNTDVAIPLTFLSADPF